MSWEAFYAICFVTGLLLSITSFLAGTVHLHVGKGLHLHSGHGHGGSRGGSYVNFGTVTAFLAWFGGTGYLLTRYSTLWAMLALALASISGMAGAGVVFWFLFKVLLPHDKPLDPADYDMIGVLGKITSSIRENGTGEIIFSQAGFRRSAGARSETGQPIPRGTEVIVTQYRGGIAYVRRWDELSQMDSASAAKQ